MATTLSGPTARGGTPSMQRAASQAGMAHAPPPPQEMAAPPPQRPPQPVSYQSDVNYSSSSADRVTGTGMMGGGPLSKQQIPVRAEQSQVVMQRVPPEPTKDLVQGYTVSGYAAPVQVVKVFRYRWF